MTELEPLRAAAMERLNAAVAAGDLTLDEFSERMRAAYAAVRPDDLTPLLAGLKVAEGVPSFVELR